MQRIFGKSVVWTLLMTTFLTPSLAHAETIQESMAAAYRTNPTLAAARAELRAVNENVPQELSNYRPRIDINASAGRNYSKTSPIDEGFELTEPVQAELAVVQPIYRGGRTVAGVNRAENEVLSQRAVLSAVEQNILLRAATAYLNVWRDEAVLRLSQNNEEVLQKQLQAEQDRFSVGEVTLTDVAQAESRLAGAQAQTQAAEANLRASRAFYREVVGYELENIEDPRDIVLRIPESLAEALTIAQNNNPNILAAIYAERATGYRVRQNVGELYPEVSVRGAVRYDEGFGFNDTNTKSAEILAQVRVPLYQAGFVTSRIRQAKEINSQRKLEINEARRNVERQTIEAWERLTAARAQIESFNAQVEAARIALEGVRQEYQVGARTTLDVLDQEQEYLVSQVNLITAQRDEIAAGFEILAAIGELEAEDVGLSVDLYNPENDYEAVRDHW